MIFKEMKQFHEENRTHVQKRTFEGNTVYIENAANAPMDLKIFGASLQRETRTGKNLASAQEVYSVGATFSELCYEELIEDGRECIRFVDCRTAPYRDINFKEKTQYTVSFDAKTVIKTNDNQMSSWAFVFTYTDGNYTQVPIKRNSDWNHFTQTSLAGKTIAYIGAKSQTWVNWVYIDVNTFQLEEGTSATDYEPYVPNSPSENYPSEIFPAGNISLKCAKGDEVNSADIPFVGYAVETEDAEKANLIIGDKYYVADYIEYDSARNKATRHRLVDSEKLDPTKKFSEQKEVLLDSEVIEEIMPVEGEYLFNDVKSIQGGCTLFAEGYSENPIPLMLLAEAKTIKGGL